MDKGLDATTELLISDRERITKLEARVAELAREVALLRTEISEGKSVPTPTEDFTEYWASIREARTGATARLTKYLAAGGEVPRGPR
jgi:uncharacterized membrane-anchored protein